MRVKCPKCGRERNYNPSYGTKVTDLRKRRVQCFFCGRSFCPVPKV